MTKRSLWVDLASVIVGERLDRRAAFVLAIALTVIATIAAAILLTQQGAPGHSAPLQLSAGVHTPLTRVSASRDCGQTSPSSDIPTTKSQVLDHRSGEAAHLPAVTATHDDARQLARVGLARDRHH